MPQQQRATLSLTGAHRAGNRLILAAGLVLFLFVALIFGSVRSADAADEPTPTNLNDSSWIATYFNNTALEGDPVLTRNERTLGGRWGFGSPADVVQSDFFSARWTHNILVDAGVWRFTAVTDDGMRIWIDDRLVLDEWQIQAERTFVIDQNLAAGTHRVRVEFFENTGEATALFAWARASGPPPTSPPATLLPVTPPPATLPPPTPVPPTPVPPTSFSWRAEYFNNRTLGGDPALVRQEQVLDINWGTGSPAPVIQVDNFSARFTQDVNLSSGTWRFTAGSDDGVRVWVNNTLIIDQWRTQAFQVTSADIWLPGGYVPVRLEFFEETENARVFLSWAPAGSTPIQPTPFPTAPPPYVPPSGGGGNPGNQDDKWRGEYYDNGSLSGSPAFRRDDSEIDFDWGYGGPRDGFRVNWFTVRWTRTMWFPEGSSRFTVEVDDGVRLFVDGNLIIDEWRAQERTRYSRSVDLSRGQHTIVLEYLERTALASVELNISSPQDRTPPIGNIITCAPQQPENYAWIKLYRLDGNNNWYALGRGIGSIEPSGFLKIDGLPVDQDRFGGQGEPYRVEMWLNGNVALSTGNFQAGEPEFRVRAFADNYTPWGCSR